MRRQAWKGDSKDACAIYISIEIHHNTPKVNSVRGSLTDIIGTTRSSASHGVQQTDAEMASEISNVLILDLLNNEPALMTQGTSNAPMTDQYDNDLFLSREEDVLLGDNNRLHLAYSDMLSMSNTAKPRYEENSLRWLTNRETYHIIQTFLRTVVKQKRETFSGFMYSALNDVIKQPVNRDTADRTISSRHDIITVLQYLYQAL